MQSFEERLEKLISYTDHDFYNRLKERVKNKDWLKLSGRISLQVLQRLEEMGESQDWLIDQLSDKVTFDGQYNFTIQDITEINKLLNIQLCIK